MTVADELVKLGLDDKSATRITTEFTVSLEFAQKAKENAQAAVIYWQAELDKWSAEVARLDKALNVAAIAEPMVK